MKAVTRGFFTHVSLGFRELALLPLWVTSKFDTPEGMRKAFKDLASSVLHVFTCDRASFATLAIAFGRANQRFLK